MTKTKDSEVHELIGRMGPPLVFDNGDDLWEAFIRYIEWRKECPGFTKAEKKKPEYDLTRPLSIRSFCMFIGIVPRTWRGWKHEDGDHFREDLFPVIMRVEMIIQDAQISGAMMGVYKENIVSRINGLVDRIEDTVKVPTGLEHFYADQESGEAESEADS